MPNLDNILLLDGHDVQTLLTHEATLECVRHAFKAHSDKTGRAFPLVREHLANNAVFGLKSGDIASEKVLGLKVAGFWPGNALRGKDAHQATILLIDPDTGRPRCLLDGNHVTAMRTGAAGGIGIETLAREDSAHVCVFGTGVQAQIQLDYALRARPSLVSVSYVTATGQPNAHFESRFSARCSIAHQPDPNQAVSQADIIITATPSQQALFSLQAVRAGTHINAAGADTRGKRELPAGLLEQATLVVDDMAQARNVGESQWSPDCEMTEIGTLIGSPDSRPLSRRADAISVFDMTGIALQDLTVALSLYQTALGATPPTRGRQVSWPW